MLKAAYRFKDFPYQLQIMSTFTSISGFYLLLKWVRTNTYSASVQGICIDLVLIMLSSIGHQGVNAFLLSVFVIVDVLTPWKITSLKMQLQFNVLVKSSELIMTPFTC